MCRPFDLVNRLREAERQRDLAQANVTAYQKRVADMTERLRMAEALETYLMADCQSGNFTLPHIRPNDRIIGAEKRVMQCVPVEDLRRWIPCSERLPDAGVSILTIEKGGEVQVRRWLRLFPVAPAFTHWMLLPELPKE